MNSLEFELFTIVKTFIELRDKQKFYLRESDDYDANNNSILASLALSDWHKSENEIDHLRQRGKEIREIIGEERAKEICKRCEINKINI
jgi:hypothetical protein